MKQIQIEEGKGLDMIFRVKTIFVIVIYSIIALPLVAQETSYFKIQVVDQESGRGIPLVELKTVNEITYYTDNQGIVAFYEPGLMNREVFFHVSSHGYAYPFDGFGYEGLRLKTKAGSEAVIKMKRTNIAERLYRITGQGIYRDSILLDMKVPLVEPTLNGQVMGQDSTFAVPYNGKIYWFWGDTARPSYPLGNFKTSGATSKLPGKGGLPPEEGINLDYFVNDQGFCKAMCPIRKDGLIWIDGLMTLPDQDGQERMVAHYSHRKSLEEMISHGLVIFNDANQEFVELAKFENHKLWQCPQSHPIDVMIDGTDYLYFPIPYPTVRVKKDFKDLQNQEAYEAFTCLKQGTSYKKGKSVLDMRNGKPFYGWKSNTDPMGPRRERELVDVGLLKREDAHFLPLNSNRDKTPIMHSGSIHWNEHRNKWIMIAVERGGESFLGEVWYAECKELTGPWLNACKVISHNRYSFYNPVHHPFFDQKGGRFIYFEGTYTKMFSGNEIATPWYDYNQIMYRLDLEHLKLNVNK